MKRKLDGNRAYIRFVQVQTSTANSINNFWSTSHSSLFLYIDPLNREIGKIAIVEIIIYRSNEKIAINQRL